MDIFFSVVLLALVLSFVAAEIFAVRRWTGGWRVAALLPGGALIVIVLFILVGTLQDRTSHNLWPLEIVAWSGGGLVFLGLLGLARKLSQKDTKK